MLAEATTPDADLFERCRWWRGERGLALEQYAPAFHDNDVDDEVLWELTADDLISIGVTSVGHRRKLLAAIAILKSETASTLAADASDEPSPTLASVSAARSTDAERRQLTVMFCDLVGSTEISASLDPEDLSDVIKAFQKGCVSSVTGFGGSVAKYMGDGALVYFGYPEAHEDDAERAIRAGLALIDAMAAMQLSVPVLPQVRVGIATGVVVVGELIGEGSSQERVAVGETLNLAARIQAVASPNSVVVPELTHRLAGAAFDYEELGLHELKGIPDAARLWRVVGESKARGRFDSRVVGGLTPLVGRAEEIALLRRRWDHAKDGDGDGDRYVLRQSIRDFAIPPTLQDSLIARLDRLGVAKDVALTASIIGREFSYELLDAVARVSQATLLEGLEQLVRSDLLGQRGAPPQSRYIFKHALIRDAAFQSVLNARKREMHERIAEVLTRSLHL